ncbi:MAG: hypothetical protein AAF645_03070 [Myxococcota bacterium]
MLKSNTLALQLHSEDDACDELDLVVHIDGVERTFREGLSIQDNRDILHFEEQSGHDVTTEHALVAIKYYLDNDAFLSA